VFTGDDSLDNLEQFEIGAASNREISSDDFSPRLPGRSPTLPAGPPAYSERANGLPLRPRVPVGWHPPADGRAFRRVSPARNKDPEPPVGSSSAGRPERLAFFLAGLLTPSPANAVLFGAHALLCHLSACQVQAP